MLCQDGGRTQVTEFSKELALPAYFGLSISSSYNFEQIYLETAHFTSTGGGFRLLNGSTNKHRGRSFMSSRVLHVTKGLSTFQLPRITLGGDLRTNPGPGNSSKYLSSFYQNVRSLNAVCCDRDSYVSNLQLLQDLTYGFHLDIVCLTETWLNKSISDFEILPTGYDIYRKDRQSRTGGGVLIAIKSSLCSSQVCFKNLPSEFEAVMVGIENL